MFKAVIYQKNYYKSYYPKRPVKSFQDLEVYQKLSALSAVTVKRLLTALNKKEDDRIRALAGQLVEELLALPALLAGAHSLRFGYPHQASQKLEEAMLKCNLAVVHLEQFRDLAQHGIEVPFFEEQIKTLLTCRMKLLHLQRAWQKFWPSASAGKKEVK